MMTLDTLARVSLAQLEQLDARHTTILTVNNRLARRVIQELARSPARQNTVAEMPTVVPWKGWVTQQLLQAGFDEGRELHAVLLDNFSSQLVWSQIIEEVEADEPLLDTQQAAGAKRGQASWCCSCQHAATVSKHCCVAIGNARRQ